MASNTTLLHVFPTFVPAGLQVRAVQLMAGFGDRFRHLVLALDGKVDAGALLPESVAVEYLRARPASGPMGSARGMRRLLLERRPDLLLTYNWGSFDAILAARWAGFGRHVHHEDGFNVDEAVRQKRRRVVARRLTLPRAFRVVVPSQILADIARDSWKLPADKVQLIPNGVHLDRFAPEAPRPEESGRAVRAAFGIPDDALVVGAVGHLRPVKNFGRLIRACALLSEDDLGGRPLHLLLVGDGPEREPLERDAREHTPPGGRVHFAGHREELAPFYRAMDVFSLSSDSEQQPVSLLEAMAARVPVVATHVGDIRAVLPEEARGHVVPLGPEVEPALARELLALCVDPERRDELARLGIERVRERYSYDAMLADYRDLYEAALRA